MARNLPRFSVAVTDGRGRPIPSSGLTSWLTRVAPARVRGRMGVAIVSDTYARALNRRYLRRDYAPDVLSFPAGDEPGRAASRAVPRDASGPFLGDVVIARGVARRQARAAAHDERTELRVLALHGLLHLLGYDHERDGGAMAAVERRLRRKGGLRDSLIERAGR